MFHSPGFITDEATPIIRNFFDMMYDMIYVLVIPWARVVWLIYTPEAWLHYIYSGAYSTPLWV